MNQINLTKSGCTQKPTLYQSLTYFLYFPNIIVCFLQLGLLSEAVIYYTILGILTPISLYSATITTLSIPTDKFLKKQLDARQRGYFGMKIRNNFDYDRHKLDSYCDLCQAYVGQNTKHCKHCNRCCQDFDHHCKWVNNCVGGLNYRIFFVMVSSTLLVFLGALIVYIRIIYEYNKYYELLVITNELTNFVITQTIQHYFKDDLQLKYILAIVMLVDSFILFALLLQLLLFHIYLIIKGITTYDFITSRTKQKINPQLTFSFPIPHLPVAQVDVQIHYDFYQVDKKKTVHEASPKLQHGVSFEKNIKLEDTISNNQIVA